MAENTEISWCDHTFNPWIGCTKVSAGCDNCYAEKRMDSRLHVVNWGAGQPRKRTSVKNWGDPKKWNKQHAAFFAQHGRRQRVFCASLADVFDNEVDPQWRVDLFELIAATPNLDWLLLTKRIGNAAAMLNGTIEEMAHGVHDWDYLPWPNVWLGATIVNQEEADRDIPKLLATPAAVRFLSCEPLLGAVDVSRHVRSPCDNGSVPGPGGVGGVTCSACQGFGKCRPLDWVIAGGESGPGARPMHPDWARSLRDQCAAAGVPFHFKQWGEWLPAKEGRSITGRTLVLEGVAPFTDNPRWHGFEDGQRVARIGKKAAGRLLDGVTHDAFPGVS